MKIAQVAPLYESVPPKYYGGTERVVSYLTEELVNQGHEVTLFASGDSLSKARLVAPCQGALRLNPHGVDSLAPHVTMLELLAREVAAFDVIHFHIDYLHFPLFRRLKVPYLTTLHGRLDIPELAPLYKAFKDVPVVSISESQRSPLPWADWQGTVYHGLPLDLLTFRQKAGSYLGFLGRICPEKGVDHAIQIAKQVGVPLKIAAKVDKVDQIYFEDAIRPLLDDPLVQYVGEISHSERDEFFGNALAILFPIEWPEPFGLVMIEAMACGTPVIAYRRGSVPEVLEDGMTGFIVDGIDEAVKAVSRVGKLNRIRIREVFETRYSVARMTADYLTLYRQLVRSKPKFVAAL